MPTPTLLSPTLGAVERTASTSLPAGVLQYTVPTCAAVLVCVAWADQGATDRALTVTLGGETIDMVIAPGTLSDDHVLYVGVRENPTAGATKDLEVSASPAFANRASKFAVIALDDIDATTPYDGVQTDVSASDTSVSCTVASAVGDLVLSVVGVDNRTAPNVTPSGHLSVITEVGGDGALCLGVYSYTGASSVVTSTGFGASACSEVAFNLKAPAAADPPFRTLLGAKRIAA